MEFVPCLFRHAVEAWERARALAESLDDPRYEQQRTLAYDMESDARKAVIQSILLTHPRCRDWDVNRLHRMSLAPRGVVCGRKLYAAIPSWDFEGEAWGRTADVWRMHLEVIDMANVVITEPAEVNNGRR